MSQTIDMSKERVYSSSKGAVTRMGCLFPESSGYLKVFLITGLTQLGDRSPFYLNLNRT